MFEIRKATLDDIDLIRFLADIAFRHTYKDILSPDQTEYMMDWMYSEESLRRQMIADGHIYYIGYEDGKAAGYVSIQPEGDHAFHLQKIYLLPSFQGKGYGNILFQHAIKEVKELHPSPCQLRLNVNRYNKAVSFYRHLGMKQVGEGDFHIGNGYYMTDYIMALDI